MLASILILTICIIWTSSAAFVQNNKDVKSEIEVGQNGMPVYPDFLLSKSLLEVFIQLREVSRYTNIIDLPQINSTFLDGRFQATGGYLKHFRSIVMENHFDVQKLQRYTAVTVPIKFQKFIAGYENFEVSSELSFQSGYLIVTAPSNEMKVKFEWIHNHEQCELALLDVAFESLKQIKVNTNGEIRDNTDKLSKWLITNFEKDLRELVAKEVYRRLSSFLPYHCSD